MKIAVIHLTDFHFTTSSIIDERKVIDLCKIIKSTGCHDLLILIGGDLTNSGQPMEFSKFNEFFLRLNGNILNNGQNPHYIFTPGNHDIDYGERETRDVIKMRGVNEECFNEESLINEKKLFSNYEQYIKAKQIDTSLLIDSFDYYIDSKKIRVVSINNSTYSHYVDNKIETYYGNDKGEMYYPLSLLNSIGREDSDLCIGLMHFPIQYFRYQTEQDFRKVITENFELCYCGHIHYNDSTLSFNEKGDNSIIVTTTSFASSKSRDSGFTVSVIDMELSTLHNEVFVWNETQRRFNSSGQWENSLQKKKKSINGLNLSDDLRNELLSDDLDITVTNDFTRYFVFPKLVEESDIIKIDDIPASIESLEEFLKVLKDNKLITITGNESGGKSTLLKYLFLSLGDSYLPIMLNSSDYSKIGDVEVRVKKAFSEQYNEARYIDFLAIDKDSRILVVDDLDLSFFTSANRAKYEELFGKFIIVINDSESSISRSIKSLRDQYQGMIILRIDRMYLRLRNKLISNVFNELKNKEHSVAQNMNSIEFCVKVNRIIDSNMPKIFLNPFTIILATRTVYSKIDSFTGNPFNEIFTNTLSTQILNKSRTLGIQKIEPYQVILQLLAYDVNIMKKAKFELADIERTVHAYNLEHRGSIDTVKFIRLYDAAKIISRDDNCYYFTNKSYLAYYAAKEFFRLFFEEGNNDNLKNLCENITDGINAYILMFLALTSQNMKIISFIINEAKRNFENKPQLDLENFKFLKNAKREIDLRIDYKIHKKTYPEKKEKAEESISSQQNHQAMNAFEHDYTAHYDEVKKTIDYMEIIGTILPSFCHILKASVQDELVKLIYDLPNKLLYQTLSFIENESEDIIDLIISQLPEDEDTEAKRQKVYEALVNLVRSSVLSAYHVISEKAIDSSTESQLTDKLLATNLNSEIQRLMMLSFSSKRDRFKQYAVDLFEKYKHDISTKNNIKLIVRRFTLENEDFVFHGKEESYLKTFFKSQTIKAIMVHKASSRERK